MGESRFHALRGRPPAPWGRLGLFDTVPDLDGDGLDDLLDPREDGMTAYSGRDGRIVWDSDSSSRSETLRGPGLKPDPESGRPPTSTATAPPTWSSG